MREIAVVITTEVPSDLLRREADGAWPDDPLTLTSGDTAIPESIGFTVPVTDFYRTV